MRAVEGLSVECGARGEGEMGLVVGGGWVEGEVDLGLGLG